MPEQAIVLPLFSKVNVKMKQSQRPFISEGKNPFSSRFLLSGHIYLNDYQRVVMAFACAPRP